MAENPKKIRPTLLNMEIGDTTSFPIEHMKGVRAQCSELGIIHNRTYKTSTSKADRLINVVRTA